VFSYKTISTGSLHTCTCVTNGGVIDTLYF